MSSIFVIPCGIVYAVTNVLVFRFSRFFTIAEIYSLFIISQGSYHERPVSVFAFHHHYIDIVFKYHFKMLHLPHRAELIGGYALPGK